MMGYLFKCYFHEFFISYKFLSYTEELFCLSISPLELNILHDYRLLINFELII